MQLITNRYNVNDALKRAFLQTKVISRHSFILYSAHYM